MKKEIYIGWDPREDTAFAVAQRSLIRHLSQQIPVHKLVLGDLQAQGLYTRPTERRDGRLIDVLSIRDNYDGSCATEHSICRFLVPHLAQSGWALFMDSDMLVRDDLAKLFQELDPKYAVYCVKHKHEPSNTVKMDKQVQSIYEKKNWSSLMIFNCDHLSNQHLTIKEINSRPGRDLHAFFWLTSSEIGELDSSWNWLVGHSKPKVVHFTSGIPTMPGYENVEFADEWRATLGDLAQGAMSEIG